MPQEIHPFKHRMQIDKESRSGTAQIWRGRYEENMITLVQSGVGKVHAAAAAQFIIDQYSPDAMFSCGTAGGLDTRCQIGDIVVGESTAQHDYGFVLPETFIHFGIHLRRANGKKGFFKEFPADEKLFHIADSVGKQWKETPQILFGSILTGDQVIFSKEKRHLLVEQFDAVAVDMESAAIAQVCMLNGVPFLSVRGISDLSDETIQFDTSKIDPNKFDTFSSTSFGKEIGLLTKAIWYFSHHPSAFALSLQARQHIKTASNSSANFVLRLLQAL